MGRIVGLDGCDVPPLLDSLDELDAAWLTRALRAGGFADARVTSFEIQSIGAGNVSDTVKVRLDYVEGSAGPKSVVCKFRCSNEAAHAHGIGSGSYLREVESYRALIGRESVCRIPYVYHVVGNAENINLVMEDLSETTRAGDQLAGCGSMEARSVVAELAKLHRGFYSMTASEAPVWGMTMAGSAAYWAAAIDRGVSMVQAHVASRLKEAELEIALKARASAFAWYNLPVRRGTLTHGDPRVDNILFADGGAILIDWQITGWRNPMHDVGYFLSGSVTTDDRRANEQDLLDLYAATFGDGYDRRSIERDYRVQLLSGLMTTLAAYGLLPLSPEVDRLLITLLRRNVAAAADWNSISAISEACCQT